MSRTLRSLAASALAALALAVTAGAATAANYVALGDSYSSGVGTASYTLNAACKRSAYAFPYLLSRQRPNTALTFVACSGATTTDVLNTQVPSVTAATDIVTITAGGNDLGFASIISNCVTADCNTRLNTTRAAVATTLGPRLDAVYAAIRSRVSPAGTVVVLGYPRLFSSSSCTGTTGISSSERANANLLSDEIDRVTALRATAHGFAYVSATAAFTGRAVCSRTPWINGLNLFNAPESFHPNRTGQSAGYLPLVRQVVG